MISDPSQLLQRIPELESLATEPRIRKAIEGGDPFKVYRALFWAKWLRKLPAQRATLKSLLGQRRLFAKPNKGGLALGTFNSVGFTFVGSSEKDRDGVGIALHAFVVFFGLPLIPLGSYLVKNEGRKGMSSRWRIYARVPMGAIGWLYSRGVTAGLAGLLVFGVINSFWNSRNQDVTILNAFDKPLAVEIAGHKQTIPAQGRVVINVPAGHVAGIASLNNGMVVDRLAAEVHSEAVYAIWNIAGAAPLYQESVVYRPQGSEAGTHSNDGEIYCGTRYKEFGSIDYAFEVPPKMLQMNSKEPRATRSHLDVGSAPRQSQAMLCINYAMSKDRLSGAANALAVMAATADWNTQATGFALMAARQNSPAAAITLAKRARDAKPDDIDLKRMYMREMDLAGMSNQVQKEYDEKVRREPNSAQMQYMDATMAEGDPGVARMSVLAQKFNEPYILRSLVWREWVNGHNDMAVKDWNRLHGQFVSAATDVLDAYVGAELALNQPKQALQSISSVFESHSPEVNRLSLASDYALIAAKSDGNPEALFARLGPTESDPATLAYYRARSGLDPDPKYAHDGSLVELAIDLQSKPDQAIGIATTLKHFEFFRLSTEHWALLFGEAARTGNQALQEKLRVVAPFDSHEQDQFKAFVRGEDVSLDGFDIDPESRAAACLVRSRNNNLSTTERKKLRLLAANADLSKSVISTAAKQWAF